MKKFAIVAFEGLYGGMHGIFDCNVVEATDYEEAQFIAGDMAWGVVESFSNAFEDMDEDEIEIDYEIQEVFSDKDIRDLARELYNSIESAHGVCIGSEFSEKYCQGPENS